LIVYLDTSSLLKVYIEERGSQDVRAMVGGASLIGTSLVTYAETRSGLARARLATRLTAAAYTTALEAFEINWARFDAIAVSESLVRDAGALAEKHLLRGFDAIHLASALVLQRESAESVTFSAWDDRLLASARAEGLTAPPHA